MLCDKCTNLGPLEFAHERGAQDTNGTTDESVRILHSEDPESLKSSADAGCHLCYMIWYDMFTKLNRVTFTPALTGSQDGQRFWLKFVRHSSDLRDCSTIKGITVEHEYQTRFFKCTASFPEFVESLLEAFAGEEDSFHSRNAAMTQAPLIEAASLDEFTYIADHSTLSSSNLALASFWLSSCLHGQSTICHSLAADAVSPRRTINIRDPCRPFLEDKGKRQTAYVALSYKWGISKRYLSLVANVEDHYRAIPLDALPKTFLDAIYVAHKLGFSHLWIDSLCIIQDLDEERNQEIQNMGSIFRGAILTLFAQDGDNADAGLSRSRDPRCNRPCKIDLRVASGEVDSVMSLYAQRVPEWSTHEWPLTQRGWVLQEEVLSPRGLHFGRDQIWWDCHCFKSKEMSPDLEKHSSRTETEGYWSTMERAQNDFGILHCLRNFQNRNDYHGTIRNEITETWYKVVSAYCRRDLTFVSDILPALAGLAVVVANSYNLQYMNGIWWEDIASGICWFVIRTYQESMLSSTRLVSTQTTVPQIPSWTWASQMGRRVNFCSDIRMCADITGLLERTSESTANPSSLDAFTTAHREDSYYTDSWATYQTFTVRKLQISGYLGNGSFSREGHFSWIRNLLDISTRARCGCVIFEVDPDSLGEPQMIYIVIGFSASNSFLSAFTDDGPHSPFMYVSLALMPTERAGEYRRVGMVFESFQNTEYEDPKKVPDSIL